MRKLCLLLAFLLLLAGCSEGSVVTQPPQSEASGENPWVSIDIYAINDMHGKLMDTDAQPGVDELSTYLKQEENTIVLSTGDMWQGASESNLTGGCIVTEWMNTAGFAAMTMGGHEFDFGEEQIRENDRLAQFPFLGINIYDRQTDAQVDYCQSSVTVEINGVQIGIIGAIGNCYSSISSEHTQGVYFKTGAELTELVKAEAEKLRSEGVDFVIYTIHDGQTRNTADTKAEPVGDEELQEYYDISLSEGYVDLVFEADTHYWYVLEDRQGVYHLQAGGNNSGISYAKVLINKEKNISSVALVELLPASRYSYLEDDPGVAELLEKYGEKTAPATEIVGNNSQYRSGSDICQLVADRYCAAGVEEWGGQYDIVLGGGYISCRSPGYMPAGEISYSQLYSLLPFDNRITLCSIQGRDLISKFLETDNAAYYIKTTEYGESVRSEIDPDGVYYVVTDSYSAEYTYNRMTVIDTYDASVFARDLVAQYIAEGGLD